jgi:hypothetical protein
MGKARCSAWLLGYGLRKEVRKTILYGDAEII